ncbi:F-box protein [Senna tora]|uniref:F-box protein n=1 Tax=Senna tora TaxID=362788 RepID=A0A834X388_9FABA|nr:F-box protein [Senna tora]
MHSEIQKVNVFCGAQNLECKCVSKRWCSIISDPEFHCIYLSRQRHFFKKLQDEGQELDQEVFIMGPYNVLVIVPKGPSLAYGSLKHDLSLSFQRQDSIPTDKIPVIPWMNASMGFVFASSNGLLLCGKLGPEYKYKFSIWNPLTRHHVELPLTQTSCGSPKVAVGFMCNHDENVFVSSPKLRFSMVCFAAFFDTRFSFQVEVFCSETWQWTKRVVSCPSGVSFSLDYHTTLGVFHDGKLYFKGENKLLVYDPCKNDGVASVINFPWEYGNSDKRCMGVSCGSLRIGEFPTPWNRHRYVRDFSGRIWELVVHRDGEEEEAASSSRWRLVYEFNLADIMKQHLHYGIIMGFHPQDEAIVFINFGQQILCLNLLTHSFKLTHHCHETLGSYFPVTPLLLPCWPTRIPSSSLDHSL